MEIPKFTHTPAPFTAATRQVFRAQYNSVPPLQIVRPKHDPLEAYDLLFQTLDYLLTLVYGEITPRRLRDAWMSVEGCDAAQFEIMNCYNYRTLIKRAREITQQRARAYASCLSWWRRKLGQFNTASIDISGDAPNQDATKVELAARCLNHLVERRLCRNSASKLGGPELWPDLPIGHAEAPSLLIRQCAQHCPYWHEPAQPYPPLYMVDAKAADGLKHSLSVPAEAAFVELMHDIRIMAVCEAVRKEVARSYRFIILYVDALVALADGRVTAPRLRNCLASLTGWPILAERTPEPDRYPAVQKKADRKIMLSTWEWELTLPDGLLDAALAEGQRYDDMKQAHMDLIARLECVTAFLQALHTASQSKSGRTEN